MLSIYSKIEFYFVFRGLLIRKPLISKKLCIVPATDWAAPGLISSTNCSSVAFCENDGSLPTAASSIPTLGARYTGHSRRKCTSSSTSPGQNGQKRCPLGVFGTVCLPFSMFRTLFESLNLVSDCLNAAFLII